MINEAIDKGDHNCTLESLQVEAAKLSGITPENSQLYQKVLHAQKMVKAQASTILGNQRFSYLELEKIFILIRVISVSEGSV